MTNVSSNAGKKQGSKRGKSEGSKATQLKKGYDPRRNMKGRPKAFDQWRDLAQEVMQSEATNQNGLTLKWNGQEITFAEFILLTWAMDKKQQEKIVEAAYGKVPQKIEGGGADGAFEHIILSPDQVVERVNKLLTDAKARKKKDAG